jgi:hypothetical protein
LIVLRLVSNASLPIQFLPVANIQWAYFSSGFDRPSVIIAYVAEK